MRKLRTEAKIGIIVLATLLAVLWGINFLKGKNILNRTDVYYGVFENAKGIDVSAPVLINGFKVGMVSKINFPGNRLDKLVIAFTIDEKYRIPEESIVELHSADLLGTMALRVIPSDLTSYHTYGDTLTSSVEKDMIATITEEISPLKSRAESAIAELDSLISSLNYVLDTETSDNLKNSISNLSSVTSSLDKHLGPDGDLSNTFNSLNLISEKLSENRDRLDTIFNNFQSISDTIARAQVGEMINSINKTFLETSQLLKNINDGKGSLGLLTKSDSLYINLNSSLQNLDILLQDLEENPKRYVHFSVFGGKNREK